MASRGLLSDYSDDRETLHSGISAASASAGRSNRKIRRITTVREFPRTFAESGDCETWKDCKTGFDLEKEQEKEFLDKRTVKGVKEHLYYDQTLIEEKVPRGKQFKELGMILDDKGFVQEVSAKGLACSRGIEKGDQIVNINSEPYSNQAERRAENSLKDYTVKVSKAMQLQELSLHDVELCVALSGGGVRAAAFGCGALWALAQTGWLRRIRHLSCVSGGSYTATAFATHLMGHPDDFPSGAGSIGEIDEWYRARLAKCVGQMCKNSDYLGGRCRIFCAFILVLLTMAFSAISFMAFVASPIAVFAASQQGATFRDHICSPVLEQDLCYIRDGWTCLWKQLQNWGINRIFSTKIPWFWCAVIVGILTFGVFCARRLSQKRLREMPMETASETRCWERWKGAYLITEGLWKTIRYGILFTVLYFGMMWLVLLVQLFSFGRVAGGQHECLKVMCSLYVNESVALGQVHCLDVTWFGEPWYEAPIYHQTYRNAAWRDSNLHPEGCPAMLSAEYAFLPVFLWSNFYMLLFWGVSCLFGVARPVLLSFIGPAWAVYLFTRLLQWVIFGPITLQPYTGTLGWFTYSDQKAQMLVYGLLVYWVLGIAAYGRINPIAFFYRCSLAKAFYAPKTDTTNSAHGSPGFWRRWTSPTNSAHWELQEARKVQCPNLIIGTTLVDYAPLPRKDLKYPSFEAPFELTPHFLGGEHTGCFSTKESQLTLAQAMGMSGAAADMAISVVDELQSRWWFGLLGLQMGSWLPIRGNVWWYPACIITGLLVLWCVQPYVLTLEPYNRSLDTAICAILFALIWPPWLFSSLLCSVKTKPEGSRCERIWDAIVKCYLRFYMARHLFLTIRLKIQSSIVPGLLYLIDGGAIDPLGALALLRRYARWMIVVDSASKPGLEQGAIYLRRVFRKAVREMHCSFSDGKNPSRSWEHAVDEYVNGNEACLHIRVHYHVYLHQKIRIQNQAACVKEISEDGKFTVEFEDKQETYTFKPETMGITYDDEGVVKSISRNSQASAHGISEGDQIVKVGTEKFSHDAVLKAEKHGTSYNVTFKVSKEELTLDATGDMFYVYLRAPEEYMNDVAHGEQNIELDAIQEELKTWTAGQPSPSSKKRTDLAFLSPAGLDSLLGFLGIIGFIGLLVLSLLSSGILCFLGFLGLGLLILVGLLYLAGRFFNWWEKRMPAWPGFPFVNIAYQNFRQEVFAELVHLGRDIFAGGKRGDKESAGKPAMDAFGKEPVLKLLENEIRKLERKRVADGDHHSDEVTMEKPKELVRARTARYTTPSSSI